MTSYYNEFDPYAAQWLRNLISAGHIARGEVDERSITEVKASELEGYTQCHFFAGIGGWSYAARLAGWPDTRPLWTGSCPCQPFSVAGNQEGQEDERHLWPTFFALIGANRPDVVMGEQVAAAVGKDWLDGVHTDLESIGYACGATVVPACAVEAPHRRDRLWFVADANSDGLQEGSSAAAPSRYRNTVDAKGWPVRGDVADANSIRSGQVHQDARGGKDGSEARKVTGFDRADNGDVADADEQGSQGRIILRERGDERSSWSDGVEWANGADGKARRVKSGVRLLAHGVPARVGKLRAYGNAIVPQVAAEVIAAYMECRP